MISTWFETYNRPRQTSQLVKARLKSSVHQARKYTRSNIRKAKTRTKTVVRSQYYFNYAYADMVRYIRRNEDIFIASLMAFTAVGYAIAVSFVEILLLFMNTAYAISDITGIDIGIMIFASAGILATLYIWALTFAMNCLSIAVMDGAVQKKNRTLRQTMKKGLTASSRVTASTFTLIGLIVGPLLLMAALGYAYIHFNQLSQDELLNLVPKVIIAAVTWVCIVLMQYSLAPYVALFESDSSPRQTLVRSRNLTIGRGRIFILLGYCLLAFSLFLSYKMSVLIESLLMLDKWVSFSVMVLGLMILANAMLVTLYRKRRLSRR